MIVAVLSRRMPSTFQSCEHCGEMVAGRNLTRHVRRHHEPESMISQSVKIGVAEELVKERLAMSSRSTSTDGRDSSVESRSRSRSSGRGSTSTVKKMANSTCNYPPADYLRDAVLCMLRRTSGVNVPDLMLYLNTHFSEIPEVCRWPLILGTFTAAQRVALSYADVLMDADPERVSSAKKSLARWLHGLSAVEPGQTGKETVSQRYAATSGTSPDVGAYSPSTNFMVPRELPVPLDSQFGRNEMEAHFGAEAADSKRQQDLFGTKSQSASTREDHVICLDDDQPADVEPVDATEVDLNPSIARPQSQDSPGVPTVVQSELPEVSLFTQGLVLDGRLLNLNDALDQTEAQVVVEGVVSDQSVGNNQLESREQSKGSKSDEGQGGDQQPTEEQLTDLDNPLLAFTDLIKVHEAGTMKYVDLTKPLLQLSPLLTSPAPLSPQQAGDDVNQKLDKRKSNVGKVVRRQRDTAVSSTNTATMKATEKRSNPEREQSTPTSPKCRKTTSTIQSNKTPQAKSSVSTPKSGLENFKIPLLPKENRPVPPRQRDDRPMAQDRHYQDRKENFARRPYNSNNFRRFRPPPESRRYTLDRRPDCHRERDRVLSAAERYWLSKIPSDLKFRP